MERYQDSLWFLWWFLTYFFHSPIIGVYPQTILIIGQIIGAIGLLLILFGLFIPSQPIFPLDAREKYGLLLMVFGVVQAFAGKLFFLTDVFFFSVVWFYIASLVLSLVVMIIQIISHRKLFNSSEKKVKTFNIFFVIYAASYFIAPALFLFLFLSEAYDIFPGDLWSLGLILGIILMALSTIFEIISYIYFVILSKHSHYQM